MFFFLSVLVTHSAKNSLFKHEKKFLLLLLFSWIVKQPLPPKRKKKLRVFHRRKNQSRALENQNLTHASPALTPFSRSVPSFLCFLVHVPGVGAKFMSGFFFFFVSFSRVFFSLREKIVVPLLLLFLLLFFLLLLEKLSFLGVRKRREKIYLSKEARVFVQRERRIFAPPLTLERYRRKGNSRRYYFFLLSFCRCCVVRFAAGNKVCHQFVTKKGCWNIFGTTDQKEKEVRKSEKEGGADSAETAQSPKGEKRFKTLVSTQNYL